MQVTVEQILKDVEKLSTEDLRKLLVLIESLLEKESEKAEIDEESEKII